MGKICGVEEANKHIQRGIANGLYPLIAHTVIDAVTLGIPYKRMLTICFCCECCCVVHRGLRTGPASLSQVVQRLRGLRILVEEDCCGCGVCIEKCPVGAISLNQDGAVISDECKGCGICIQACPDEAIKMEMGGEETFLASFNDRMNGYAVISSQLYQEKPILKP
jgi:UDP-glucose 4-epimerase